MACIPHPAGLPACSWYYFAVFTATIVGLVIEPVPGAVVGLLSVIVISVLSPYVLFSPQELSSPGFNYPVEAFKWAVSGFANDTVWLIFSAFMFALGYEKTGLGQRISLLLVKLMGRRTLTLGYAVAIADLILAPFTPSNTARSAGTIYPVIKNLPPLYGSYPGEASAGRIGSYLMWVSVCATCVTSTMFLSALAPNLLASALIEQQTGVLIKWSDWFFAMLPVGVVLWFATPWLAYYIYPPEVKVNNEVPLWAEKRLAELGRLTSRELRLICFVILALVLWVGFSDKVDPAVSSLIVIALMLLTGVISWDDIISNKSAWNTFFWFATLVALASGLTRVGFVSWLGELIVSHINHVDGDYVLITLVVLYFFIHYFFASGTAHVTALIPLIMAIAMQVPGVNITAFSLFLCGTQGIMGIITPYATGPSPVYYGSGYLPSADYWRLGAVFGIIYLLIYLLSEYPWMTLFFGL